MTHDQHTLDQCICDGTFGESKLCRTGESYLQQTIQPKEIPAVQDNGVKLCANATFYLGKVGMSPWLMRKNPPQPDPGGSIDWDPVDCTNAEYK